MINRTYLKDSVQLCGESDKGTFLRTFRILGRVDRGAGATCVCYKASHTGSGCGILKEFYPANGDAYATERNGAGQLVVSPGLKDGAERFRKEEKKFLEPYEMLLKIKQSEKNRDVTTFIPDFEIYHGCDDNGNIIGTTYIWTPDPTLVTFDRICEEIHENPDRNPEYQLVTVLEAMETLTNCICALHTAGMLHRDIKPSNFGFQVRRNKALTQSLTMFDIGSLCSLEGAEGEFCGTPGFMAPETEYRAATIQSDLYSIGATLFFAIIATPENKAGGYFYRREYYDRLRQMVDESRLIRASEANSHPKLKHCLVNILERSLCMQSRRYEDCEELLKDIETALYYALPTEIAKNRVTGEKLDLKNLIKFLDAEKEKSSFRAIQFHLFRHPLYCSTPDSDSSLNILVAGFGKYGQKFLDACLQNGQMPNKRLNIAVVSDDPEDKTMYLKERPQLKAFFAVDRPAKEKEDTYGNLAFEVKKIDTEDVERDGKFLWGLFGKHYTNKWPRYIFIALGDDGQNLAVAKALAAKAKQLQQDCTISYVCEEGTKNKKQPEGLLPVFVNNDLSKTGLGAEIERMAFNTHLIWDDNLNVSASSVKAQFGDEYYHDSCVSNVLSMKYKLYSIGIDLDKTGFDEAARLFGEFLKKKDHHDIREERNQLIGAEHRRWVVEKLCLGWRRFDSLSVCAGGMTKDIRNRRHICIVKSGCNQKLKEWQSLDKWDTASPEELGELDDLDRLSVDLHRLYCKKAKEVKTQNLLAGRHMASIRELIRNERKATVAFQEWFACLRDIWNGDRARVHLYKGLKETFLASVSEELQKAVKEQVRGFEVLFDPVRLSMEYRDWKQIDTAMIDNIPFILTYTDQAYFVIPFITGSDTEVFGNVASATVAAPEKILYLYWIKDGKAREELLKTIPGVMGYMEKKKIRAAVEFILFFPAGYPDRDRTGIETGIVELGNGKISQVKSISVNTSYPEVKAYLEQRSVGKKMFAVERNNTRISGILEGMKFPAFSFDSDAGRFYDTERCEMLDHISKKPFITVSDMLAFRQSFSEGSSQPEFFDDYKELWEKYRQNRPAWKLFCRMLREYSEKTDTLLELKNTNIKTKKTQQYRYRLPLGCYDSAVKILDFLKKEKVLEPESEVRSFTTDSCEVTILEKHGIEGELGRLFSRVYELMDAEKIAVKSGKLTGIIQIRSDNLSVSDLSLEGTSNRIRYLLKFFSSKGYILGLREGSAGISFTYATWKIKELLTAEGKILEIYTYHKAKELGFFDDVVSGYQVNWQNTGVENEFDCILTKGFRSLFVECKARNSIEADNYYKINALTKQFGIHATAVIVTDTITKGAPGFLNAMERDRGDMMDVVTVWEDEDIEAIDQTLLRIINGEKTGGKH